MTIVANPVPYLRTSRNFPEDLRQLSIESNRSYIDIASAVNARTIGLFPTTIAVITGDSYYLSNNSRQQSLREVYVGTTITAGTSHSVPHGIQSLTQFSRIYGTCVTSLPDYRPLPYASTAANTNIDLRVDSTNIIISVGAGSPNITSFMIVLEWISRP